MAVIPMLPCPTEQYMFPHTKQAKNPPFAVKIPGASTTLLALTIFCLICGADTSSEVLYCNEQSRCSESKLFVIDVDNESMHQRELFCGQI